MKRFWREVTVERAAEGWQVALDGRPVRTQGGAAQIVPGRALAEALAKEWRAQGETVDPRGFALRDLADYAIDRVTPDPAATVAELLRFAETDTLSYRADPEDPLWLRQQELWEPLLAALEAREGVRLPRISGVIHRPPDPAALATLRATLERHDPFTLVALQTMASLTASLTVALTALEEGADAGALWHAATLEEEWQAARWGRDAEAGAARAEKGAAFRGAFGFARLIAN